MPRLVHRVPAYSRHAASGQARVKINGRSINLGRYGSPESRQAYANFIASLSGQPAREPKPIKPVGDEAIAALPHMPPAVAAMVQLQRLYRHVARRLSLSIGASPGVQHSHRSLLDH